MHITRLLFGMIFALAAMLASAAEITFVVPGAPGSATDMFARNLAKPLEQKFDIRVVIENHPGADQIIGLDRFSKIQGPAVFFGGTTLHVFGAVMQPDRVDVSNLEIQATVAGGPSLWFTHPNSGIKNAQDLIVALKQNRKINIGSNVLANRINALVLVDHLKATNTQVLTYKNEPQLATDVAAGVLDVGLVPPGPTLAGLIEQGKIIPLATVYDTPLVVGQREVPSMARFTDAPRWSGMTFLSSHRRYPWPPEVDSAIRQVLQDQEFRAVLINQAYVPGTADKQAAQRLAQQYTNNLKKIDRNVLNR